MSDIYPFHFLRSRFLNILTLYDGTDMLSRNVGDVTANGEQQTRRKKIWNLYFWLGLGMNIELS
jgi:hypothetical protein